MRTAERRRGIIGFRVQGAGCKVRWVQGSGCKVQGARCAGFRVHGAGFAGFRGSKWLIKKNGKLALFGTVTRNEKIVLSIDTIIYFSTAINYLYNRKGKTSS
jgi:hypothetical protein